MILLAAVKKSDKRHEWQNKIKILANFLDLIFSSRIIEAKSNTYDNLRDFAFEMARSIRDKGMLEIEDYIRKEWTQYYDTIFKLPNLTYSSSDKSDLLFVLARIACFLEEKIQLSSKVGFVGFLQRDRGTKTFDIEHLLCKDYDPNKLPTNHGFTDAKDYSISRDFIGALALLPRSRNRSLQDKSYNEKLKVYSTENILTQSLCSDFYENNPVLVEFKKNYQTIELNAVNNFNKNSINERASIYLEVAKIIWKCPL
jgi:hypothetical protein